MLTLDLALITYGKGGIDRVASMNLPTVSHVSYVVSWQASDGLDLPAALVRPDISVFRTDSRGASVNRNNAIDHCTADLVLFSDDDLIYTSEQLASVIAAFENNPDMELATFKATHPHGPVYPEKECDLTEPLPKGYFVSSYQIAFRRLATGDLRCHPDFGAGSKKYVGADDELFLLSAIRRGIRCRFIPTDICTHPNLSTGTTERIGSGNLQAMGCYIHIAYRHSSLPRILLKSLRVAKSRQAPWHIALYHLLKGHFGSRHILKGDRRYLW